MNKIKIKDFEDLKIKITKIDNYDKILNLRLRFIKLLRIRRRLINLIIIFNKNNIINKDFIKITKNLIKKKNIMIMIMKINRRNHL